MSAFLCDHNVIYKTMKAISVASKNSWNQDLKTELDKNPKKMFNKLNYLNRFALNQRYQDPINEGVLTFNYYEWLASLSRYNTIECYKALTCFMYQCSEGSTTKKKLYKSLDKLENNLASFIISKLPEYQKAAWS